MESALIASCSILIAGYSVAWRSVHEDASSSRANKPAAKRRFQFDAALSFAGTSRVHAEKLFATLKARGIRVFYDRDQTSFLWGKPKEAFAEIYGPASRFVVPFVSKDYGFRDWTQYEFAVAKREAARRQKEFILPIRVDDSLHLGIHDDCSFLSVDEHSADQIADAVEQKLWANYRIRRTLAKRPPLVTAVRPLSSQRRAPFGLIALAPSPLSVAFLSALFPAVDWPSHIPQFKRQKMIAVEKDLIVAVPETLKAFGEEPEHTSLHDQWMAALLPLAGHVDTAILLALLLIRTKQFDTAASILCDVAEGIEPGTWLPAYTTALSAFAGKRIARKLSTAVRFHVWNSTGLCHAHAGSNEAALQYFDTLHRAGLKASRSALAWAGIFE